MGKYLVRDDSVNSDCDVTEEEELLDSLNSDPAVVTADRMPIKIVYNDPDHNCHWFKKADPKRIFVSRLLAYVHIAAATLYLWYRASHTIGISPDISWHHLMYQIVFYIAEVLSFVTFFFVLVERWAPIERDCVDFYDITPAIPREQWPTVCVFVPCYNEEVDLVRDTVVAASNMEYPREFFEVYLLDDGNDEEKEDMINALGIPNVYYMTRPDNSHAKAGNINHALSQTDSDLVVIFDADFIPHPMYLQRTLPYYFNYDIISNKMAWNERLGFVQAPQYFRNVNQIEDPFDIRSTFFFEWIIPGRDGSNSTPCVGTNFIANRSAMEDINGMPTKSITEDVYMSMLMQAKGYMGWYTKEYLCVGMAPETLAGVFRQRSRWVKGMYMIMFNKDNPLLLPGLNWLQRLSYFGGGWNYGMSMVTLFFMISLPVFMVFGIPPMDLPDYQNFVYFFVPFQGSILLYQMVIQFPDTANYTSALSGVMFSQIFTYYTIKNLFVVLFNVKLSFKVTLKKSRGAKAVRKAPVLPTHTTGNEGPMEEGPMEEEDDSLDVIDGDDFFQSKENGTAEGNGSASETAPQSQDLRPEADGVVKEEFLQYPTNDRKGKRPSNAGFLDDSQSDSSRNNSMNESGEDFYSMNEEAVENVTKKVHFRASQVGGLDNLDDEEEYEEEEVEYDWSDRYNNLTKVWFNIIILLMLSFSVIYGLANPIVLYTADGNVSQTGPLLLTIAVCLAFYYTVPQVCAVVAALHIADYRKPVPFWVDYLHNTQHFALWCATILIIYQGLFIYSY
eukprot:Nk52_evm19s230 gene=Nk52_evmTU19s230